MAHVSYAGRIVWAIGELCATSVELHDSGEAPDGEQPLDRDWFVDVLTGRCDHPEAAVVRARVWATLADEAGVPHPDLRVRKQVLNRLRTRKAAA